MFAHAMPWQQGESRDVAPLILKLVLDGVGGQRHELSALPPERNRSAYYVQVAELAPVPV
jgi:hypothetical protein